MIRFFFRGLRLLASLPKTIYFNFHYLPFSQAYRLPFFVDANARLIACKGSVKLNFKPTRFCIKIGGSDEVILNKRGNGLRWKVQGNVVFNGPAKINYGCGISVEKNAVLTFGEKAFFNIGNLIICAKQIEFGKGISVAWQCTFIDSDFHDIVSVETGGIVNEDQPILIDEYVWIGHNSTIRKGVHIRKWNIIGANSTVSKNIEGEKQIWAGSPAKLVREGYYRPSLDPEQNNDKKYR